MQGKSILVVGYGKLGQRIAHTLSNRHDVIALKRSPIEQDARVKMCFADVTYAESVRNALKNAVKGGVDYLIYCLSPNGRSEQAYRDAFLIGLNNVLSNLPEPEKLKHILFISSTSVYHQAHAEQVDEQSACLPSNFSGKVLLEAEAYLRGLSVQSTCIRFSGIYGGSRSRLIDQVKYALESGNPLVVGEGYTNRIHEDDCVGFICHLIDLLDQNKTIESCYLATDSCPVELVNVYQFIADQLIQQVPNYKDKKINIRSSEDSNSLRRAGSKLCLNKKMLQSGYAIKFETYKQGYSLTDQN
jgi:nucleoside-diphosphate-sugar epimerase